MAGVESMVEKQTNQNVKVIDREKTCPLLLRVFCSTGRHHSTAEFAHGNVPTNEVSTGQSTGKKIFKYFTTLSYKYTLG